MLWQISMRLYPRLYRLKGTYLDRGIRRDRYPPVIDSPTLPFHIIPHLLGCLYTLLVYAHPGGNDSSSRDFVMSEDHSTIFAGFVKDIELQTTFNVFEVGCAIRESECLVRSRCVTEDVRSTIAIEC